MDTSSFAPQHLAQLWWLPVMLKKLGKLGHPQQQEARVIHSVEKLAGHPPCVRYLGFVKRAKTEFLPCGAQGLLWEGRRSVGSQLNMVDTRMGQRDHGKQRSPGPRLQELGKRLPGIHGPTSLQGWERREKRKGHMHETCRSCPHPHFAISRAHPCDCQP